MQWPLEQKVSEKSLGRVFFKNTTAQHSALCHGASGHRLHAADSDWGPQASQAHQPSILIHQPYHPFPTPAASKIPSSALTLGD